MLIQWRKWSLFELSFFKVCICAVFSLRKTVFIQNTIITLTSETSSVFLDTFGFLFNYTRRLIWQFQGTAPGKLDWGLPTPALLKDPRQIKSVPEGLSWQIFLLTFHYFVNRFLRITSVNVKMYHRKGKGRAESGGTVQLLRKTEMSIQ